MTIDTSHKSSFSEQDILSELDLAFQGIPGKYYPVGDKEDIKYNFFIDLEHGYFATAGNRIHLYADENRWAIVFEKNGYANRAGDAEIELDYFGNCINYPVDQYPGQNYITNAKLVTLITGEEYLRIQNKSGPDMEQFELIAPSAEYVLVRSEKVSIEHDEKRYSDLGIKTRDYDNPRHLIGFEDLVRYISETEPDILHATKSDIMAHLPADLPEIVTINEFHFESAYESDAPASQETYQLIAKVLVNRDPELWEPQNEANNHWSNWESGHM